MPNRTPLQPKILIVDDEEPIRMAFAAALGGSGYRVVTAADGLEALESVAEHKPALILLDLNLPAMSGWKVLERLRAEGFKEPVIVLTGLGEIEHRVRGLTAGADDYLCKPCDLRELIARVHAILRRSAPSNSAAPLLRIGATTLDLANRTATRNGEPVQLTRTEFAIVEIFARHPGQLVTRKMMLEGIWGYTKHSNTRTIDTHVWRLRQKLDDNSSQPRWIHTVSAGGGYRMLLDESIPVGA